MDFPRQEEEERVYSDDKEEEEEQEDEVGVEEDEEEGVIMTSSSSNILPFSSPFSSSSSSTKYQNFLAEHRQFPGSFESHLQQDHKKDQERPSLSFERSNNKLEFMDLTLGSSNSNIEADGDAPAGSESAGPIEREHMFDKVVTPSDVGKLNRLVIPKQHAEKYFPLDASSNEKGLLLNFEDRNGKPWRFRYSYWNSSQSYVMTKGWSRFVKEKKLDAGDIVSFQRGVGESGKHRLFIDWRRRPSAATDPTPFAHLDLHNQLHFQQSVRWGRLYSLPQTLSTPRQYGEQPHQLQQQQQQQQQQHLMNYCIQPYHHRQYHHHHQQQPMGYSNAAAAAQYHSSSSGRQVLPGENQIGAVMHQQEGDHSPMVIDSMPVLHGKTVGKRLRLFGVNMECPIQDESSSPVTTTMMAAMNPPPQYGKVGTLISPHLASPCTLHVQPRVPGRSTAASSGQQPSTMQAQELSKKGKTSLSFDLDL